MQAVSNGTLFPGIVTEHRAAELFRESEEAIHKRTDRMFAKLMACQWVAGIAAAIWISPLTWIGAEGQVHWHVWAAIFLGGAISGFPIYMAWKHPGRPLTRHVIAVGQMMTSALLIHLTGGRIETHFHVFGSLAFLAVYRDWRVLVTATVVVAADHFFRGVYWPQSVFGVLTASPWRWVEHAGWVIFEDFFLIISIRQSIGDMRGVASRQAKLEAMNTVIERQVAERTADVRRLQQHQELVFNSINEGIHWINCEGRIVFENPASAAMLGWEASELVGKPAHVTMHHTRADGTPYLQCNCPIYAGLQDGQTRQVHDEVFWRKDGTSFPVEYTVTPVRDKDDAIMGVVVVFKDITERKKAEKEAALLQSRFQFIFGTTPIGITWMIRGEPSTRLVNPAHARITGVPLEQSERLELYRLATHPDDRGRQDALHQQLEAGKIDHYIVEKRYVHPDGKICWTSLTVSFFRDKGNGKVQELCTLVDITERKEAEIKLEKVHKDLLEASRRAGMTEVATSVLHNVGNVLNSVNVSATLVADQVRASKVANLAKVNALLEAHEADVANFLANDPQGRLIRGYLSTLASHLTNEQGAMLQELELLRKNMEHIKEIVTMQQSYSKVYGIAETLPVVDLVEDALRMNAGAFARHDVTLIRDYQARPIVTLEKHKVLQILVNIMRNAKYACDESGRTDKKMRICVSNGDSRVKIAISDNGVGIPRENLARIFAHGFTTRKEGHGYGLHSGALAAKDLGGSLTAHSEGPGHGATFVLELPFKQEGIRHE